MSTNPVLEFKDIHFSYGRPQLRQWLGFRSSSSLSLDECILKNISFSVAKGEFCGLIGKNGAGKSTLLKLASGVFVPNSGSVTKPAKVANLLELGAAFNMKVSGRENLYLTCLLNNIPMARIAETIERMIEFADIGKFINEPVDSYSSGMMARLAFASQVYLEAELILVDEVLSVGDASFVNKANRKMDELRDNGTSFLFVSHDMTAVKTLCNRAFWLEDGEIRQAGPAGPIVDQYLYDLSGNNEADKYINMSPLPINIEAETYTPSNQGRRGLGKIVFKNISVNSGSQQNNMVMLEQGNPFTIKAEIENLSLSENSRMNVGVSLRNNRGVDLTGANAMVCGNTPKVPEVGKTSMVEITVRPPILHQGDYSVTLSLTCVTTEDENISMDTLLDAFEIRVFGHRIVHSYFLLDAEFKFTNK